MQNLRSFTNHFHNGNTLLLKSKPYDHLVIQGQKFPKTDNVLDISSPQGHQIRYVKNRTSTRIHTLKQLSSIIFGVEFKILCIFYVQVIRSIIDFSVLSLLELLPLDIIQDVSMLVILGIC